ncbi:hypothetical protein [Neptunitalea lumnitzerae]|uniref:Uncharacterized protein n=1 Tax=Neptunitalea lumnitzerae TaxID=2965509 RepID=A0ABQ5MEG1_9FLAO|nr:hypothetical protein [Neptunitalea sp. Y10]GLB47776.1 hypothetical protein Y10_01440 [Neptunitalea sp. Y10]
MKPTFSNQLFNWLLLGSSFVMCATTAQQLAAPFEFLSVYIIYLAFATASVLALLGLIIPKMNGERFARFFILTMFILPPVLLGYRWLINWAIYGINLISTSLTPAALVKLVLGIVFMWLTTKFSKQTAEKRQRDYGIYIILIGAFLIIRLLVLIGEAFTNDAIEIMSVTELIFKLAVAGSLIGIGERIRTVEPNLAKVFLALPIFFLYGLF